MEKLKLHQILPLVNDDYMKVGYWEDEEDGDVTLREIDDIEEYMDCVVERIDYWDSAITIILDI